MISTTTSVTQHRQSEQAKSLSRETRLGNSFGWSKALFITCILLGLNTVVTFGQTTSLLLRWDAKNTNYPLALSFELNSRKDVSYIILEAEKPTRFAAWQLDTSIYTVLPLSEQRLVLRRTQDTLSMASGNSIPLLHLLTDSATLNQRFTLRTFNRNGTLLTEQYIAVAFSSKIRMSAPCDGAFLSLNTGSDLSGSLDRNWVVQSQSSTAWMPTGPISNPEDGWLQTNNSMSSWISSNYSSACGNGSGGDYTYKYEFCTAKASDLSLSMVFWLNDGASTIKINGALVPASAIEYEIGGLWYQSTMNLNPVVNNIGYPINPGMKVRINNYIFTGTSGTNTLTITQHNGWPNIIACTGINVQGSIQSNGVQLALNSRQCCTKTRIYGRKMWDANCNGRVDVGEKPLNGWTIKLTSGQGLTQTVVTDAYGNYAFDNVIAGTYTLEEQSQNGWSGSVSSGPFTVVVDGTIPYLQYDFLNCKQPRCTELFHIEQLNPECCQLSYSLNPVLGSLTSIQYQVSDGIMLSTTASPCHIGQTSPANITGTIAGTLVLGPPCTSVSVFQTSLQSTTASGVVCLHLTFNYQLGASKFSCDTTLCLNCHRMPQQCRPAIHVTPHVFSNDNLDWRHFVISDTKIPHSHISSVDLRLSPESAPHHSGGGLRIDASTTTPTWTFSNSGGPTDAYTSIRLQCKGATSTAHGPAALNQVAFNLAVDNTTTPQYSGIVHIHVGYCDGDTCDYSYAWNPPMHSQHPATLDTVYVDVARVRIARYRIAPPDSTVSISIRLKDSSSHILAVSPPMTDHGNLSNMSVSASPTTVLYTRQTLSVVDTLDPDTSPPIAFDMEYSVESDQKQQIQIRFFDKGSREIGYVEREIVSQKVDATDVSETPLIQPRLQINELIPNPANDDCTVSFSSDELNDIKILVVDLRGETVMNTSCGHLLSGKHSYQLNVSALPVGAYTLVLQSERERAARSLVVRR